MSRWRKIINFGRSAQDGKGDPLRDAFEKINANFLALFRSNRILLEEVMILRTEFDRKVNCTIPQWATLDPPIPSGTLFWSTVDERYHVKGGIFPEWSGIGSVPFLPGTWYLNAKTGVIGLVELD